MPLTTRSATARQQDIKKSLCVYVRCSAALVASAAGDPFATDLRDDLTAAALRKEIVLDIAAARADAAQLWKDYQEAHPGAAQ